MSELVTKSAPQEQQEQRIETRTAVKRIGGFTIVATAVAVLAVLGAVVLYAQSQDNDKYSLKSPSGIAFSDFRGYEDWADVSSARTDEMLKVIVAQSDDDQGVSRPAFRGNGQPFPDGSMIVKLQWKPKKSTEAPSSWMCQTSLSRLSSWKRTARDFRKAAGGDTRCSTTMPHRTSSRPMPKAPRTADTRAIRQ